MRITIITLFPEVFTYLDASIIKRARERGLIDLEFVNPRDFTVDRHRTVDDVPYGGGPGMVLKPEPFFRAVSHIRLVMENHGKVVVATPQGKPLNQALVQEMAAEGELIFLCGHYEGFDERIRTLANLSVSIGDYVLTGGELPVMVMVDAIARMIPGVIDADSAAGESFQEGLLEHPQYTRPPVFEGMAVPPVLLSGHHENIRKWRRKEALRKTLKLRPDLLEWDKLTNEDKRLIDEILKERGAPKGLIL